MSTSKLKVIGPSTIRWKSWRTTQRALAVKRSNGDNPNKIPICEWHGTHIGPEWNHVFGRMHIIEEPWASYYPLTIMLCSDIHNRFHELPFIQMRIRWRVLYQFADILGIRVIDNFDSDPIPEIRQIVRELNEQGVMPDGFRGSGGNK
jgi:hypothetical protein